MIDINLYPEGEELLLWLTNKCFGQDLVDFGCGNGRLAPFFSKRHYVGWDTSPVAITMARAANPGFVFNRLDPGRKVEGGYSLLAHDVLLHIPDEEMKAVVKLFTQKMVIVSEVLGRESRAGAVFNREVEEYVRAFLDAGYRLHRVQFKEAENISSATGKAEITALEFHKQ